ncbi:hypothetical protein Bbelb_268330 [Branchiostoma belcheri]|nr:hypothetical protein Bbelb_268330 [Branchiostoma belcheri]
MAASCWRLTVLKDEWDVGLPKYDPGTPEKEAKNPRRRRRAILPAAYRYTVTYDGLNTRLRMLSKLSNTCCAQPVMITVILPDPVSPHPGVITGHRAAVCSLRAASTVLQPITTQL